MKKIILSLITLIICACYVQGQTLLKWKQIDTKASSTNTFVFGPGAASSSSLVTVRVTNTNINGTGTVDIGAPYGLGGVWLDAATITNDNFSFVRPGGVQYVNSMTDSSGILFSHGNAFTSLLIRGKQTSVGLATIDLKTPRRTNMGAGFNLPDIDYTPGNSQWIGGTIIPNHYQILLRTARHSATSATTLTDDYGLFSTVATPSTNLTITNLWGYGTNGGAHITGSVVIGRAARTPVATADITGPIASTGNYSITTAGAGLIIKSGTNAKAGTVTLSSGTAVVANTAVTATSYIFFAPEGSTNAGELSYTKTVGVGFTVNSSSGTDSRTIGYIIIEIN